MGSTYQLHAPLGNGSSGLCFQLAANFVNDDHFRHVVFHCLDHHFVLENRSGYLHSTRPPNAWVGDVPVTRDFVGGVHHNNPFLLGQHPGCLAQQRGLAHARSTQQQDVLARLDDVLNDVDGAVHRSPHPAGESYNTTLPVANG